MPLAAPDFAAGWNDPAQGANRLFTFAGWIFRRCKELRDEPDIDVFKLYDAAGNCFMYREEAFKWIVTGSVTLVLAELVRLTQAAGKGNAVKTAVQINSDYTALYGNALTFLNWARTNLPNIGAAVPNVVLTVNRFFPAEGATGRDREWGGPDFTARVPKTAGITNAVTPLLATFD